MTATGADHAGIVERPRINCAGDHDQGSRFSHSPLHRGAVVTARDASWRIRSHRRFDGCALVSLAPARGNPRLPLTLVSPADRIERLHDREGWRRATLARACAALARGLRTQGGASCLPGPPLMTLPWQFAAARSFVESGATRVLLADDVGLGKTVQAALAMQALEGAGRAAHVLILVPAGLRDQWQQELGRLFGWSAVVVDARELYVRRGRLPAHLNPWQAPGIAIASLDFVKQPEVLAASAAVAWDLVVIDEAHALAPGTDRLAAADTIARSARRVLLLTATPHSGDRDAFAAMCQVGALRGDDTPLDVIRRTAAAVGRRQQRRTRVLHVRSGTREARVHSALDRYIRRVWSAGGNEPRAAALLAMTVLLKRAASSMTALARSLAHRARCLDEGVADPVQPVLPFEDPGEIDPEDTLLPTVLAAPGFADRAVELRMLHDLLADALGAIDEDPKPQLAARFARRVREPVLVFTEYRDTLQAVVQALGGHARAAVLHGAMSRRERADAVRAFTSGRERVLVATDVAAEGLNLHTLCRIVLTIELPWTPTRLEQRIGRVDRLGQARRVHAVHLLRRNGVEPWLASRLAARRALAEQSLEGLAHDDPRVDGVETMASALNLYGVKAVRSPQASAARSCTSAPSPRIALGAEHADWTGTAGTFELGSATGPAEGDLRPAGLRSPSLRAEHLDSSAARLVLGDALLRAVISRLPSLSTEQQDASGPRVVRLSRPAAHRLELPAGITFVVSIGYRVGSWMPAPAFAVIAFALEWPRAPATCAGVIRQLLPLARIEAARLAEPASEHAAVRFAAASLDRERALLSACARASDAGPLQAGLFDRRAERQRACVAGLSRQRAAVHRSHIAAVEADAAAGPELTVEPLLALVVR